MKKFYFLLFYTLVLNGQVYAQTVYKGLDAEGNPIYSDQPLSTSEKIEIKPIQTYTPPPTPNFIAAPNDKPTKETNYQVNIVQPQNDQTMTTEITSIQVILSLTPPLNNNDKIRYLLNNQPYGELTDNLSIKLNDLPRGAYSIQAQVISPAGDIKGKSQSITFYQKRAMIKPPKN